MTPTKTAKLAAASADALEDTQFSLDGAEKHDDAQTSHEPPKKRRKKAPPKNKKVNKTANPTSATDDGDVAPKENAVPKANGGDAPEEDSKPPPKPAAGVVDSSAGKRPLPVAVAGQLKQRKKQKAKAKHSSKKEKAKAEKCSKEETCLHIHPASESTNESSSIGLQPPDLQINYLKDRQKRALPLLSDLELEGLPLEKSWLLDVSDKPLRAQLGAWLETGAVPGLQEAVKESPDTVGAPAALVISGSALRAVDLCREVKRLVKSPDESGEITKLFARHFKLAEHANHLKATKVSIGVGTPDRISKLLAYEEDEPLKLDRLRFLILDVTWLDSKGFNLPELPDPLVKTALWKSLLGFPKLLEKFQSGQTKIILF